MRHSFEQNIYGYNEVARDIVEGGLNEEQEKELSGELAGKIRRAAYGRQTSQDAQREIYDIQEKKQKIMSKLKDRLALIDDPDFVPPRNEGELLVVMDENGDLVVKSENGGEDAIITKGELVTDIDWGMYYYLDPASVDRKIRRRYVVEDAKQVLMENLDEQITIDETSSQRNFDATKIAYEKRAKSTGRETGFIAETMVKNFLKKLSYDYNADFTVLEADAHQDVALKSDFIIRRRMHRRGVGVEEGEVERVGVQFTVNTDKEVQDLKHHQVETIRENLRPDDHIDDVVLVTVPSQSVRETYDKWNRDRRPGGPDKLWDMQTKEDIFRKVMEGILMPEEIDEQWGKISGRSE